MYVGRFPPCIHTSLVKRMCILLPPTFTVAQGKQVLFVFLLEILTDDKGPKPKVFWHTCKKCSQASQKVHPATSTLVSAPPAPSSVPTISLAPYAQSTSMVAPVPKVAPPRREDDMSIGSCPMMLTPSLATPPPRVIRTNADFIKSFPQSLNPFKPLKVWLDKAAHCKLLMGHLVTAFRTAEHAGMLSNSQFVALIQHFFPSYPMPPASL
jgi:hypothetical protein